MRSIPAHRTPRMLPVRNPMAMPTGMMRSVPIGSMTKSAA